MSYNPETGIISVTSANDGVSVRDVQKCVPVTLRRTNTSTGQVETVSSNDVGVLCSAIVGDTIPASDGNGNWTVISRVEVNKWAKFKPVRFSAIDTTDEWDFVRRQWKLAGDSGYDPSNPWWKAGGGCGFSFDVFAEIGDAYSASDSFFKKLRLGQLPWTYLRPRGGISEPFRLTDFAQHNRNAIQPFGLIDNARPYHLHNDNSAELSWEVLPTPEYNLQMTDFAATRGSIKKDLTDFYLGLLFFKNTASTVYHYITSQRKFSTGDLTVTIDNANTFIDSAAMTGTWQVVPFFSTEPYSLDGPAQTSQSSMYLSLCGSLATEIVFTKEQSIYFSNQFTVEWNAAATRISASFTIINSTSLARTNQEIRIVVRRTPPGTPQQMWANLDAGSDLVTYTWTGQTIPANGQLTLSTDWALARDGNYEYAAKARVTTLSNIESGWNFAEWDQPMAD